MFVETQDDELPWPLLARNPRRFDDEALDSGSDEFSVDNFEHEVLLGKPQLSSPGSWTRGCDASHRRVFSREEGPREARRKARSECESVSLFWKMERSEDGEIARLRRFHPPVNVVPELKFAAWMPGRG